jgi:hypothetical protein
MGELISNLADEFNLRVLEVINEAKGIAGLSP